MEEQEGILEITNKAYTLGKTYYSQAMTASSLCGKNRKMAESQMHKISIFTVELRKQLQVVLKIVEEIRGMNVEFASSCKKVAANYNLTKNKLDSVLDKLKAVEVGDAFKDEDDKMINTLFDYVNTDSLTELQDDIERKINRLVELSTAIVGKDLSQLNEYGDRVKSLQKEVDMLDITPKQREVVEIYQSVNEETKQMENYLNLLSRDLESVKESPQRKSQSNLIDLLGDSTIGTDAPSKEEKVIVDSLPEKVERLAISLEKIMKENSKMEEMVKEFNDIRKVALSFFLKVETMGEELKSKFNDKEDIYKYESQLNPAEAIRELGHLIAWYEKFLMTFRELEKEKERREKYDTRLNEMIDDFTRQLDETYIAELNERETLANQQEQYLPPYFMNFTRQPPGRYHIDKYLDHGPSRYSDHL